MLPSRKRLQNINIQNLGIFDKISFSLRIQKAYITSIALEMKVKDSQQLLSSSHFFFFGYLRSIQCCHTVKHFNFINVVYPQEIKIALQTQINLAVPETPVLLCFSSANSYPSLKLKTLSQSTF